MQTQEAAPPVPHHNHNPSHRVVVVVYPFQTNPMLELATMLHSKGFSITIAHPEFNSPDPHSNHPEFTYLPIKDGFVMDPKRPPKQETLAGVMGFVKGLSERCLGPFEESMKKVVEEGGQKEEKCCILYDVFMYFAQIVAENLKLPGISVSTSAAATLLGFSAEPNPKGGYVCFPELVRNDPELQALRLMDFVVTPSGTAENTILEVRTSTTNAFRKSAAIIVNTIEHLEQPALKKVQKLFRPPILPMGPFHKYAQTKPISVSQEDTQCLTWLDKQPPKSVIYVSFGSVLSMKEDDLLEVAWGLANSEQRFLWVARPGMLTEGHDWTELLPLSFKDQTKNRGLIVRWAPQREVLSHGAVGAFWSHCGWNSTLESICEGVPMLCRPSMGDQILDACYVSNVWKTGIELEKKFEREHVERAIRKLLGGKEGEMMRKRAMEVKEAAESCFKEGGSSYKYVNQLIDIISSF